MKQRVSIFLAILLVAVVGTLAWRLLPSREPVYEKRRLSDWLQDFGKSGLGPGSRGKLREAIRQMGTNSLPTLLAMLQAEDSLLKLKAMALVGRQPFIKFRFAPAQERRLQAFFGLDALGPIASPAVPELLRLLNAANSEIRNLTAQALGSVAVPEAVVVAGLTNALRDPDARVRMSVEESLGRIHKKPETAIPALVANLTRPDPAERRVVIVALSRFGAEAESAIPTLAVRCQDEDARVREAATSVVQMIRGAADRLKITIQVPTAEADVTAEELARALGVSWWAVELPKSDKEYLSLGFQLVHSDGRVVKSGTGTIGCPGTTVKAFIRTSETEGRLCVSIVSDNGQMHSSLEADVLRGGGGWVYPVQVGRTAKLGMFLIKGSRTRVSTSQTLMEGEFGINVFARDLQ